MCVMGCTKVGYSSYGPEVGISAPAGNCVNILSGQPCLFPFVNTINFGATTPAANGYTGIYDVTNGPRKGLGLGKIEVASGEIAL